MAEEALTRLDIGLSKEDQDRIASLKQVNLDGEAGGRGLLSIYKRINHAFLKLTPVKLQEKVTFYQLLAVMINAGVPIIRSLYVLADQNKNPRLKEILQNLAQNMEQGSSLSDSMEMYADIFSDAERGMIASGEASGNLNHILKDIAKQSEKSARIVAKVKGAMIYPAAIITILAIALFIMLTMVVPKITELFAEGNAALPLSTEILLFASDFAQHSWEMILLGIGVLVLAVYGIKRTEKGSFLMDKALLYIPVFGGLVRKLMISRFARLLASLMLAGIPIVKALEINANALGNAVYKRRVKFAAQDVAQGIPLGENLTGNEFLFPPMVSSMILVGEQTANLAEVSTKIADYYEDEVDTMVASLSKLMEPIILVVMGGLVGFIVAAIMQPIMALSDLSGVV